jgi:hypothetical protein
MAEDYHGWVIGSEFAFFLVIRMSPEDTARMMAGGIGLLGGLLAAASASLSDNSIKRPMTRLTELAEEITDHADWPVDKDRDYPVVVLPKLKVKRIRYSWWRTFDIVTAEQTFYVGLKMFGREAILKRLRGWGWQF